MNANRPARYLILEEKPNPSTDYFVLSHVRDLCSGKDRRDIPVQRVSWGEALTPTMLAGACVILVRYVTAAWRHVIDAHRHEIHELVYFFDDDIPDTTASRGLPLKYRYKLYRHGARHFNWLVRHNPNHTPNQAPTQNQAPNQNATLWVSTAYLQDKYRQYQPMLLEPKQLVAPDNRCRVFYHATASHADEIAWLLPVMKAVLEQAPHVEFEIVGDIKTLAMYRNLPRTVVVHPMSWQAYQGFVAWPGRHIGLAPFLPSAFNAARSYTKLFDIERAGARGILADSGPWAALPAAKNHTLLPMDQARWVAEIVTMSQVAP